MPIAKHKATADPMPPTDLGQPLSKIGLGSCCSGRTSDLDGVLLTRLPCPWYAWSPDENTLLD